MSFSLPPAQTLNIILDEPSICNQTVSFDGESIEVNKSVLAAHSTYFRSLWFLEFGDKLGNPIDFSHLPVTSDNFFLFVKSFFGKSFNLNESNAYNYFYLVHYFQVDKLIDHVENHLNTHLATWAWLKPFVKEADERNDLRALEFVGSLFSKIDDMMIDDMITISTEGLNTLSKYCTSTQSQSWFSLVNQHSDLKEEIADRNVLTPDLSMEITNVKTDSSHLMTQHSDLSMNTVCLTTDIPNLTATMSNEITKLQPEIEQLKTIAITQLVSQSVHQSEAIKFSQTRKHPELQVSDDGKRVVHDWINGFPTSILGEDPLLPGNDYTWKMRYHGYPANLWVGVIDESNSSLDDNCFLYGHGIFNHNDVYGCLAGHKAQWNPGELLEINVNLINYTLTIKSVRNSVIELTGTLPRLSSGNYFLHAEMYYNNHVLEIVD
ncbi:hypothetical protein GEMRC1_010024 [Eukaryota sp. GEM-RC1]